MASTPHTTHERIASSFGVLRVISVFRKLILPFFCNSGGGQGLFIGEVGWIDNSVLSRHPWRRCQLSWGSLGLICVVYSARYASHPGLISFRVLDCPRGNSEYQRLTTLSELLLPGLLGQAIQVRNREKARSSLLPSGFYSCPRF